MNKLLTFAGRHGPIVLFGGVLLGLVLPEIADAAKPLMAGAVFAFTLGAFLKVDRTALQEQVARPWRMAAWLAWSILGVPAVAWVLISVLPLPPGARTGIFLCMLGPPVGSAAAMAAMLRLNPALALTVTVLSSLISPLTLVPGGMWVAGLHLQLDPLAMMLRMVAIVGGACIVAMALRRFAGGFVRANPLAMTGISVLGLIVVAIGAMQGMGPQLLEHSGDIAVLLLLAFAVNAGFQVIGAIVFARHGVNDALTVGLLSGNRNVTLVWVAVAPWLGAMPGVELYLAASVFPIFMLPLPMSYLLAALRRRGAVAAYDSALPASAVGSATNERRHPTAAAGQGWRRRSPVAALRAHLPGTAPHRETSAGTR